VQTFQIAGIIGIFVVLWTISNMALLGISNHLRYILIELQKDRGRRAYLGELDKKPVNILGEVTPFCKRYGMHMMGPDGTCVSCGKTKDQWELEDKSLAKQLAARGVRVCEGCYGRGEVFRGESAELRECAHCSGRGVMSI
jgi:hypothetical protein